MDVPNELDSRKDIATLFDIAEAVKDKSAESMHIFCADAFLVHELYIPTIC